MAQKKRYRANEPITDDVKDLIKVAQTLDATQVQRFVFSLINTAIDEELEALAVWVASEWDPNVETDHVRSVLASGQTRRGVNAVIAQMRRETAAEVRRHKRRGCDDFIEIAEEC